MRSDWLQIASNVAINTLRKVIIITLLKRKLNFQNGCRVISHSSFDVPNKK